MKLKKFIKNAQIAWDGGSGTGTGVMGTDSGSLGFGTPGGGGSGLGQRTNLPPSHQGHPGNLAPGPWSGDSISDEPLKIEVFDKKIGDFTAKELIEQIRSLTKINTPESRDKVMFLKQVLDDKMHRMKAARTVYDTHIITKNAALVNQLKSDLFVQSLFQEHDVPIEKLDEVSSLPEELTHFALHNLVHRIITAGLEEKIPVLSKKYDISEEEVRNLANYDSTNTKSYLDWIIRHRQELRDQQHTQDVLKVFEKAKKSQALPKKDINQYKTFEELETILHSIPEEQLETTRGKEKKQTETGQKVVYNKSPYKVLEVTTPEAMAHLARDTEWCVKDPKFFAEYKPPFHIVLKNEQPYVLVHRLSSQIKDVEDEEVEDKVFSELESVFKVVFNIDRPELITSGYAYGYAEAVIEGRWPEGEEIIKQDPWFAYLYAINVIKGRWPEGEETIKRDPNIAYEYARDVIKGRWPEAEEVIMQDPGRAYAYAREIIEGRWPEAEGVIMRDPETAEFYNEAFLAKASPIKHFTKTAQLKEEDSHDTDAWVRVFLNITIKPDLGKHGLEPEYILEHLEEYWRDFAGTFLGMAPSENKERLEYDLSLAKDRALESAKYLLLAYKQHLAEEAPSAKELEEWFKESKLKQFIRQAQTAPPVKGECPESGKVKYVSQADLVEHDFKVDCPEGKRHLVNMKPVSILEYKKHKDKKKRRKKAQQEDVRLAPEFNDIEKETQAQTQLVFTEKEKSILEKVKKAAEELNINTFLVGGAVRDKLLGKEEVDMDFVCEKDAEKMVAYLAEKYGTQGPVQYGRSQAIMITVDEVPLDFINAEMLFRPLKKDQPLEGEEEFTFSFDDAYRRDLTINTLMYDIRTGKLLDPTGKGLDDLHKGVINTVIDPFIKFKIHAADMLRALRFATVLGFELGPDMIEAMKANAERIVPRDKGGDISNRRIRRELRKAIDTPQHWAKMRELLQQAGLDIVLDEDIRDVQTDFEGSIDYIWPEKPQVKEASSDSVYEVWMNDTVLYAKTDLKGKADSLLRMLKDKGHQAFIRPVDKVTSFMRIKNFVKIAGILDIFKQKKEMVPFGAATGAERYDYLAQKLDAILIQSPAASHQQVIDKFLSDYPQLSPEGKTEIMSRLHNFKIVTPKDKEIRWGE